jgi:hypothetical protein
MALVGSRQHKRLIVAAVVLAGAWLAQQAGFDLSSLVSEIERSTGDARVELPRDTGANADSAARRIERAIAARESGFMITVEARVSKLLRDDLDGSRHQRFLIELDGGQTLLVAHNIDLAKRAEIEVGDSVRVRGQYEWNDRGGLLHWTHHDPDGDHPGGWVESGGSRVD